MKVDTIPADSELLSSYVATGSEGAFAELVHRHLNLVHSAALRQVQGDAAAAADVAQTVFIELARQASGLTRHPALIGWLYTTTHRMAARHVRDGIRRQCRERDAHAMREIQQLSDPEIDWSRLAPVLDRVMHELAEADRLALLLRYFEKRPFVEVGARLGLNENAARMRVDRALDRLRRHLADRGITSTASALALVLSGPTMVAAPEGLASGITVASVASIGAASTMSLLSFMTYTKAKVLAASALVCLVGTGLWMQHRRWDRLRQQQTDTAESLTAANAELVTLRTALENASNQLAQVATVPDEMLRLRGEVARLRREGARPTQEAQSDSDKPGTHAPNQRDAATALSSTIPLGQSLLTGGWRTPSGKRALVVVQPTVDNSGAVPVITLSVHMLEGDEEILRTKGYGDLLDPNTEDPPRRMLTQAELQAWLDNDDPGFKINNLMFAIKNGHSSGLDRLFETTRGVGTRLDFVPRLSTDGNKVHLLLTYGMGGVNDTGSAQSPTVPHPFYQFP